MRAAIVGFAVSRQARHARYVPIGHESNDDSGDLLAEASAPTQISRQTALERLRPLLEDAAVRKVGHDLKFDLIVLSNHGIALRGIAFDSMLASYLLDATRSGHPHRGRRARAARVSRLDRGGRLRQGHPSTVVGATVAGSDPQLCR